MANPPPSHYPDIGHSGEDLVVQWLQSTDWIILHRRFCCRWGEIDIIAQYANVAVPTQESTLAFVEVKTRSPGNWDLGGRSTITLKKQAKIIRTAEIFLAANSKKADYPCRFDVAIVSCQIISQQNSKLSDIQEAITTSSVGGYQFHLQEYIPAAFECVIE